MILAEVMKRSAKKSIGLRKIFWAHILIRCIGSCLSRSVKSRSRPSLFNRLPAFSRHSAMKLVIYQTVRLPSTPISQTYLARSSTPTVRSARTTSDSPVPKSVTIPSSSLETTGMTRRLRSPFKRRRTLRRTRPTLHLSPHLTHLTHLTPHPALKM